MTTDYVQRGRESGPTRRRTGPLLSVNDAVDLVLNQVAVGTGVLSLVWGDKTYLRHFGSGRAATRVERQTLASISAANHVRWLALFEDAALARRARPVAGGELSCLSRRDVARGVLDLAEGLGLRVGFLTGSPRAARALDAWIAWGWPTLVTAGSWSASRHVLEDFETAGQLAAVMCRARADVLVVLLAAPQQERWIAENSYWTGAKVCLALGPSDELLRGAVAPPLRGDPRGPRWQSLITHAITRTGHVDGIH